jgi:serine protease Do
MPSTARPARHHINALAQLLKCIPRSIVNDLVRIFANDVDFQRDIRPGDVLRSIDGKEVADGGQLRYSLATQGVGKALDVVLYRAGREEQVRVTLATPPETPLRQLTPLRGQTILNGVTVANLSPAYAQELGIGLPEKGVVVVQLASGAPAARIGLRPGDLIESVGGTAVRSVSDVAELSSKGALSVRWSRDGQSTECGVVNGGQFACRR